MQAASIAVYIFSGLTGMGFIATFVICIVSLMLDFWTVRGCVLRKPVVTFVSCQNFCPWSLCFIQLQPCLPRFKAMVVKVSQELIHR